MLFLWERKNDGKKTKIGEQCLNNLEKPAKYVNNFYHDKALCFMENIVKKYTLYQIT